MNDHLKLGNWSMGFAIVSSRCSSDREGDCCEAGDDGVCVGIDEALILGRFIGVGNTVGSRVAGCFYVGELIAEQCAGVWLGSAGDDGLME